MNSSKNIKCIIVDDENIARDILQSYISKVSNIEIVANCRNAIEAFHCINNNKVDLVFLDINMPEVSGISFAKSINKEVKIIFTTAYRDYAVEGFELRAVDYLLKPFSYNRFLKAVAAYFEVSTTNDNIDKSSVDVENSIFVRSNRIMQKVDFDSVLYVESFSDYIKIHTVDEIIMTRETISAIEARLPKEKFARIHRAYIISLNKITSFTKEFITIENESLPISRSYKKNTLQILKKFS